VKKQLHATFPVDLALKNGVMIADPLTSASLRRAKALHIAGLNFQNPKTLIIFLDTLFTLPQWGEGLRARGQRAVSPTVFPAGTWQKGLLAAF
jgi:hypothetical protein